MPTIAALTRILQTLNMTGFVIILLASIIAWRRWPDTRLLLVAPIIWSLYGIVFYGLLLVGFLSPEAILMWGALHRSFAVAMVIGYLIALWLIQAPPLPPDDRDDEQ